MNYRPEEIKAGMACGTGNFTIKLLQFWNAGHDACLTVECWPEKATINLQLTIGDKPLLPLLTNSTDIIMQFLLISRFLTTFRCISSRI